MRPKSLNFDELVERNKQELLRDEKEISQLELNLEKKQSEKAEEKQD
ncbi:FbpB family small basic protein [Lentibacillus sediminis]|nr:FbpB family small basic protein [Lentibacillus sediminis]